MREGWLGWEGGLEMGGRELVCRRGQNSGSFQVGHSVRTRHQDGWKNFPRSQHWNGPLLFVVKQTHSLKQRSQHQSWASFPPADAWCPLSWAPGLLWASVPRPGVLTCPPIQKAHGPPWAPAAPKDGEALAPCRATSFSSFLQNWPHFRRRALCNS